MKGKPYAKHCLQRVERAPVWSTANFAVWKGVPGVLGGGKAYIQQFKTAWVRHNRDTIKLNAMNQRFPPELLAGVCWIEVGGDPNFVDAWAFMIRSIAASFARETGSTGIAKHPNKTSFGAVSIQLLAAAETLGLNAADLSNSELRQLAFCLQNDVYNIEICARHLRQLIDHDGLQKHPPNLTMDQIRIVGARYNRGTRPSLESIRKNTSYGDFIVRSWSSLSAMLNQ
jgi:hypothetical protein